VDTVASGLAVFYVDWNNSLGDTSKDWLQVVHPDGSVERAKVPPAHVEMETAPLFWGGRVWMVQASSIRGIIDSVDFSTLNLIPGAKWDPNWWFSYNDATFDSAMILSSSDGSTWDTVRVATGRDSINSFRLKGTSEGIHLILANRNNALAPGNEIFTSTPRGVLSSTDGRNWQSGPATDDALDGFDGWFGIGGNWDNWLVPSPGGVDWTICDLDGNFVPYTLIPGISNDTSRALLRTPGQLYAKASPKYLALQTSMNKSDYFGIALPSSPSNWQRVIPPEPVQSFCFWQGKLVVLGASGIHIATIQ